MKQRYARTKLTIPDDYVPGETPWNLAVLCYPDTPQWRGLVRGALYELTRGRKWAESTGRITDAQAIARQIWESLDMGCNTELTRIADALEQIAGQGKTPIDDIITNIGGNSKLANVKNLLEMLKTIYDLVPGFDNKINLVDLAGLLVDSVSAYNSNRHQQELVHLAQMRLMLEHGPTFGLLANAAINMLPGGTLADSLTDTDEYILLTIDTIIAALTGTSTVAALLQISGKLDSLASLDSSLVTLDTTMTNNTNNIVSALDNALQGQGGPLLADLANLVELPNLAEKLTPLGYLSLLNWLAHLSNLDDIADYLAQCDSVPGSPGADMGEFGNSDTLYNSYKCLAANYVYDFAVKEVDLWQLEDWSNVLQAGASAIGTVAGITGGALLALGAGLSLPVTAIAGGAVALVVTFIGGPIVFDPADVKITLQNNKSEIIAAMYTADNTQAAKDAIYSILEPTLSPFEAKLADVVLFHEAVLNLLFTNNEQVAGYNPPNPVACDSGGTTTYLQTQDFAPYSQMIIGTHDMPNTDDSAGFLIDYVGEYGFSFGPIPPDTLVTIEFDLDITDYAQGQIIVSYEDNQGYGATIATITSAESTGPHAWNSQLSGAAQRLTFTRSGPNDIQLAIKNVTIMSGGVLS